MDETNKTKSSMGIQERMEAPLTWEAPPYCEIMDFKEYYYDEVLRLIRV